MAERSRIKRYENLRRKIENQSYFSLEKQDSDLTAEYVPDPDPSKAPKPSSSDVRHNTITVPLSQILKEQGEVAPQHAEEIPSEPAKKQSRRFHLRLSLRSRWWKYLLLVVLCIGVVCAIVIPVIIYKP